MAGKKQRPYEYAKALKRQSPGIQAMIREGEKKDEKKAKEKAAKLKKKRKKKLTLLQKTKKRLRRVFKGY